MNKSRLRLTSALALLAACLFFIGASPFLNFEDGGVFGGQMRAAGEMMAATGKTTVPDGAKAHLSGEMTVPAGTTVSGGAKAYLSGETAVPAGAVFAQADGLEGVSGVHAQPFSGHPGAVDMVIGQPAVRGAAAGVSGVRNTKNTRGFFMSLLILYMLVNTLIIMDKSCFYVKNQRSIFYVRYSLIILNVIHQADGKRRQIQVIV